MASHEHLRQEFSRGTPELFDLSNESQGWKGRVEARLQHTTRIGPNESVIMPVVFPVGSMPDRTRLAVGVEEDEDMYASVRSRLAHHGIHVPQEQIRRISGWIIRGDITTDHDNVIGVEITNVAPRGIQIRPENRLLRLARKYPRLTGEMIAWLHENRNRITVHGREGEKWDYSYTNQLQRRKQDITGMFVAIERSSRKGVIPHEVEYSSSQNWDGTSFRQARQSLESIFYTVQEEESMPDFCIAETPFMHVEGVDGILSETVYRKDENGLYVSVDEWFQTSSPLFDGDHETQGHPSRLELKRREAGGHDPEFVHFEFVNTPSWRAV